MKNGILKTLVRASILTAGIFSATTAIANEPEAIPGEYVVRLKPQAQLMMSSKTQLQSQLNNFIKSSIPGQNIVVVKRAFMENADSAIKSLRLNPMVEVAEPNYIYRIKKTPDDPMFAQLWGMLNVGQKDPKGQVGVAGYDTNVTKAWDLTTGSKGTIVAIIDTGIDYNHPDLKDNMWVNEAEANGETGKDDDGNGVVDDIYGYNAVNNSGNPMDDQGHGSHCAGTIGAKGNNGVGVAGVNWDVRLMAVKFLSASGSGSLEDALKAIDYATKMGAKIQSNSWGGGGFSQTLFDAIERSNKAGAIFIAAAGNEYNNNDSSPTYPASYQIENVLAVAAIDNKGIKADFSNFGRKTVHLGAPGVNILSTTGGKYQAFSGTSMATPHVAGVAALLSSYDTSLTGMDIKRRLVATARPIAGLKGKTISGGMVDAYAALTNTTPPPDANDPANWVSMPMDIKSASPYLPNTNEEYTVSVPGAKEFSIYFEKFDTESGYDTLTIFDSAGNKIQTISGNNDDLYSFTIPGNTAKLVFKSDRSVEKGGWSITKAAYR